MKAIKNIISIVIMAAALLTLQACDDGFDAMNRDPLGVTSPTVSGLFNKMVNSTRTDYNEVGFLGCDQLYPQSQLVASAHLYGVDAVVRTQEGVWNNYFVALAHFRNLQQVVAAEKTDPNLWDNAMAMARILMAYRTLRATDYFGDMPYENAGYAYMNPPDQILRPAFDSQESIYLNALDELKVGVDALVVDRAVTPAGNPYASIGSGDPLMNANVLWWKKFGNSLRLRYALRMHTKKTAEANTIIADALTKPLLGTGDDVVILGSKMNDDDVHRGSFHATPRGAGVRLGVTLWNVISSNDAADGSGIFDPRARIFFEPNKNMQWVPIAQSGTIAADSGDPYNEPRSTNFNLAPSDYNPISFALIYDLKNVPDILMSAAEVSFLKAEVYLRGIGVARNTNLAAENYGTGIRQSVTFWQDVKKRVPYWPNRPADVSQDDIDDLIAHVALTGSDSDMLKQVYAQYWLSLFWQPAEAFYLMRRTQATPVTGAYDVTTYSRMTYPPNEAIYNATNYDAQVARMGGDNRTVKVWWMP